MTITNLMPAKNSDPLTLLGGLSATQFMRRYWHKKPLLIRAAIPGFQPLLSRRELFDLASRDDVESRLVRQKLPSNGEINKKDNRPDWELRAGPFSRRMLPAIKEAAWTLLVQGVDLHHAGAYALLQKFRFIPDARLDDLMVSFATEGGGVGPHFDSYDVFLLQASGQRRWQIGRQKDLNLQTNVPLKLLKNFKYEQEYILQAGDMLYLPPRYAHDGVAVGDAPCMTYSIGFKSPARQELASQLLQRLAEEVVQNLDTPILYKDARQVAVKNAAQIPVSMQEFARRAVQSALKNPLAINRALGAYLTEPKANVWFEGNDLPWDEAKGVQLARATRMLVDKHHLFVNGECWHVAGRDATLLKELAAKRCLNSKAVTEAGETVRDLLREWHRDGWVT